MDSRLSSLANLVSSRPAKEYASKPTPPPRKLRTAFEELPNVGLWSLQNNKQLAFCYKNLLPNFYFQSKKLKREGLVSN